MAKSSKSGYRVAHPNTRGSGLATRASGQYAAEGGQVPFTTTSKLIAPGQRSSLTTKPNHKHADGRLHAGALKPLAFKSSAGAGVTSQTAGHGKEESKITRMEGHHIPADSPAVGVRGRGTGKVGKRFGSL